ncbi:MAG: glycosyltransferase family 4 protein [Spirochaetes bacterium]|jgi:glycosyltransferase involved in cell wall biosynthesis|nr:glycosyltransferase family 4 protein [Spirochaetota bacterium]
MKVLLLCYRGNPFCGGQGIYIYHLSRELARIGVEADVIVGPPYPDPLDEWSEVYRLENLNIWAVRTSHFPMEKLERVFSPWNFIDYLLTRFHVFPEMETFSMRAFSALRRILRKKRYDIIHDVNTMGWGLIPMKAFGIPIISTVHHPLTKDREADFMTDRTFWEKMTTVLFYPLNMQRFVIKALDRVITSSYAGVDELYRAFGVDRKNISVVYNGIDVDAFKNTGQKRDERSLLFVGNTDDRKKGFTFLAEALSMMPDDVRLTIVDSGPPEKMSGYDMVKKFGVEKRVKFVGKVDHARLVSLYSTTAVLVMPSLHEGFGLPVAEAMACGTPVVASAAGALKEVVDDNTGILVPPENAGALSEAIMKLLADRGLRMRMGANGRKRVVENFSWPVAAEKTLEVYKSVINGNRG